MCYLKRSLPLFSTPEGALTKELEAVRSVQQETDICITHIAMDDNGEIWKIRYLYLWLLSRKTKQRTCPIV